MNIIDEIKKLFKSGNIIIKVIFINVAVFIAINLLNVIFFLFNLQGNTFSLIPYLAVPADLSQLLFKPWTIITYMFLHESFFHILFNMLWFYWFAQIFLQYFDERKLVGLYILSGISGALLYILAFNLLPVFSSVLPVAFALGASASVLGIVIAISLYKPDYTIHLMFIGPVRLKYIALFTILIDILSIASSNSGGYIAHLGGAMFGYLFVRSYNKGNDLTKSINKVIDWFVTAFKPRERMRVEYKRPKTDFQYNKEKANNQKEVNRILDKISKSGYDSLTKKEKEILFKAGK